MNPPSVTPRHCHWTSGPPPRSGVAVARGTRAHGRFVAATFSGLILRHRYQAALKWRHRHQGKDGWSAPPPPPGCKVRKHGPSPRLGGRTAPKAHEAYDKSSPLLTLLHLLIPPGYVPPPVSIDTRGSRHGTLTARARHGDYCHMAKKWFPPKAPTHGSVVRILPA